MCQLRLSGATVEAIAATMDERTLLSVRSRLYSKKRDPELRIRLHDAARHFTEREDQRIVQMKADGHTWAAVADALPGRCRGTLKNRYCYSLLDRPMGHAHLYTPGVAKGNRWTAGEDEALRMMRKTLELSWAEISVKLSRSKSSLIERYHALGCSEERRAPLWTREEDAKLLAKTSEMTWKEIAAQLPGRTHKGACTRYAYLQTTQNAPARKKGPWTPEEDALLLKMRTHGASYETTSAALSGRTSIACVRRIQHIQRKRVLRSKPSSKPAN